MNILTYMYIKLRGQIRFGRKKTLVSLRFIYFAGGILAAVGPQFWVFCLAKITQGLCGTAIYVGGFVIGIICLVCRPLVCS